MHSRPSSTPIGRGATWPLIGSPRACARSIRASSCRQLLRRAVALRERDRHRPPGVLDHPAEPLELVVEIIEVRDHLDHPGARPAQPRRDPAQLGLGGRQGRRRRPRAGLVLHRARRREAERPGAHRLRHQVGHRRDLAVGRDLAVRPALAHHEHPQRAVRQLRAHVDVVRHPLDRVEVLREARPRPRQPLVQRRARDVLDALHQLDQHPVVRRLHRREPDPAVAEHRRRHAVQRRRREPRVPRHLTVVVGVDVDEPGRHQAARRVDLLAPRGADRPDLRDHPAGDRDVGAKRLAAATIDHRAVAEDEIRPVRHAGTPFLGARIVAQLLAKSSSLPTARQAAPALPGRCAWLCVSWPTRRRRRSPRAGSVPR